MVFAGPNNNFFMCQVMAKLHMVNCSGFYHILGSSSRSAFSTQNRFGGFGPATKSFDLGNQIVFSHHEVDMLGLKIDDRFVGSSEVKYRRHQKTIPIPTGIRLGEHANLFIHIWTHGTVSTGLFFDEFPFHSTMTVHGIGSVLKAWTLRENTCTLYTMCLSSYHSRYFLFKPELYIIHAEHVDVLPYYASQKL